MENEEFDSTELDGDPTEFEDTEVQELDELPPDDEEEEYVPEEDAEEEEAAPEKTYKMKIKGEEKEISASELKDFFGLKETEMNDEIADVLVKSRQIHVAGQQAFTEASNAMKQIEAFVSQFQSDPLSILKDPSFGIDFDKLAEDYIIEKLQLEMMPEAERKALQLQKENEQLKKYRQDQESNAQKQQFEQQTEAYTDHFANDIASAVQEAGLPVSKEIFASFSRHMRAGYQQYGEVPSAKEVLPMVQKELAEFAQSLAKTLPPEKIAELFGEDALKKVRQFEVKRVKSPKQAQPGSFNHKTGKSTAAPVTQGGKKALTIDEFRNLMNQRVPIR